MCNQLFNFMGYENWRLNAAFIELSNNPYPERNQPNSWPIYLRSILTLSFHLQLGLHRGLFPLDLPVKILKALLLLPNSSA